MNKRTSLVTWARSWHWPQLVLDQDTGTVIRAGEQSWRAFVVQRDRRAKKQARERMARWDALAIVENGEESPEQITA